MGYEFRLYKDELVPQAAAADSLAVQPVRAIYVVSGGLRLTADGATAALAANSAWHNAGAVRVAAGPLATVALRWELAATGAAGAPLEGAGVTSALLASATLPLDRAQAYLLRCDRVDFPPGGEALLHTHRGGGIRCLLSGSIEIATRGARHSYRPLQAWFEAGPDPVYAAASPSEPTAFARAMILPRSLLGKSSISYVNPEDIAKPKSQRYQVFVDAPVELPEG
jgi:quercetin dioxygenase-like cupin family protein